MTGGLICVWAVVTSCQWVGYPMYKTYQPFPSHKLIDQHYSDSHIGMKVSWFVVPCNNARQYYVIINNHTELLYCIFLIYLILFLQFYHCKVAVIICITNCFIVKKFGSFPSLKYNSENLVWYLKLGRKCQLRKQIHPTYSNIL